MCLPFVLEYLMVFFFLFWFDNDLNQMYPYHTVFIGLCFILFYLFALTSMINIHCIFLASNS